MSADGIIQTLRALRVMRFNPETPTDPGVITDINGVPTGFQGPGGITPLAAGGGSTRTFRGAVVSQAAMLALATVNVGDWVERSDLSNQIFELTTTGQATLANWTAYPVGVATLAALTDIASFNFPGANTATANAIAAKATPGIIAVNPIDTTTNHIITAADFAAGIMRINSTGSLVITLPTVLAMALTATPGVSRMLVVLVLGGGIPTFQGQTSSTIINGVAGPTAVLPVGGSPATHVPYLILQESPGADYWSMS